MRNLFIGIGMAIVLLCATIHLQHRKIERIQEDRDSYRSNSEVLLQDVEHYKTCDSLSAAKVGVLQLEIAEYQKYRSADARLIESLRVNNRELERVNTIQTQTIAQIRGSVRDSIIYKDVVDTVKHITVVNPWFNLNGVVEGSEFRGSFESRDSLLITSTVEYKRFMGFLWKTSKVKSREVDVVSRNPYTLVLGVKFVEIR